MIIHALAAERAQQSALRAAVMFYPICRGLRPWKVNTPALMLIGSLDDVNPPQHCQDLAKGSPKGTALDLRIYDGARHNFDDPSLGAVAPFMGSMTVGHHKEATTQAWAEVKKFLAAHLKKSQ